MTAHLLAPLTDFPDPDLDAWRAQVGAGLAEALATAPAPEHLLDTPRRWRIGSLTPCDGAEVVVDATPELDLAPYHRAGAEPAQELAYLVARLHPRAAEAATLRVGFEVGRDLFEQVAKLRAARVLWHKTLAAAGAADVPLLELRATTAWRTLTRREPMTNVLRATTQAYAAVLGGADVVVVRPHEDTDAARRLAVQLQLVLRHEAQLDRCADPLAGSYHVEQRTDALARAGWDRAREILDAGGLDTERAQRECDASWEARAARLRAGETHVLGVSLHPLEGAPLADLGEAGPSDLAVRRDEEVFP